MAIVTGLGHASTFILLALYGFGLTLISMIIARHFDYGHRMPGPGHGADIATRISSSGCSLSRPVTTSMSLPRTLAISLPR